jgi:hypothetical protein
MAHWLLARIAPAIGGDHFDHQSSDPVVADATNFLQQSLLPNKREPHQKTSVE